MLAVWMVVRLRHGMKNDAADDDDDNALASAQHPHTIGVVYGHSYLYVAGLLAAPGWGALPAFFPSSTAAAAAASAAAVPCHVIGGRSFIFHRNLG